MKGVVAAGDRQTAACAVEVLQSGGNAVDAAIAGAAAAFVAEPLLASAGGAGMMTVALPERPPAVVDFFSNIPGLGLARPWLHSLPRSRERLSPLAGAPVELDFEAVDVHFGATIQEFHAGRGAAAVPGALPGLAEAHRQFGSLPLTELMAPAVTIARAGITASPETAMVFGLLWQILCRGETTPASYTRDGRRPEGGDLLVNPALADTLTEFGRSGDVPEGLASGLIAEFGPTHGGLITAEDVRCYRPQVREALAIELDGGVAYTSPAVGGQLVEVILRQLFAASPCDGEAEELLRFARASQAGHMAREGLITPGSTTHLSVVDSQGGVAAVTLSNGEGCGHVVSGTGVQVNNFLGEEDLNPHGFHRYPAGGRLPTMMAPTVVMERGRPVLALGSGGSNRIRTAVGQVLYRIIGLGESAGAAIARPRIHAEGDKVWFECGGLADRETTERRLAEVFAELAPFEDRAFFFGGVHTVHIDADGRPHGVGDPRRGGVALSA